MTAASEKAAKKAEPAAATESPAAAQVDEAWKQFLALTQPVQPEIVQEEQPDLKTYRSANPVPGDGKTYSVQVGSYRNPKNALWAYERLSLAGFSPKYQLYQGAFRVLLAGLWAEDIQSVRVKLEAVGFKDVLVKEEPRMSISKNG
jgi:cell division protein FtsN